MAAILSMGAVIANSAFTVGQYLQNATTKQITESVSNGIWYEILRGYFAFGDYFIVPESRSTTGSSRPDLVAYRYHPTNIAMDGMNVGQNNKCFCLEGKGKLGPMGFCSGDNFKQIQTYIGSMRSSKDHDRKFGIFVAGDMFMVLATESNGIGLQYVRWSAANADLLLSSTNGYLSQQNILYLSQNAAELDSILRKIATLY